MGSALDRLYEDRPVRSGRRPEDIPDLVTAADNRDWIGFAEQAEILCGEGEVDAVAAMIAHYPASLNRLNPALQRLPQLRRAAGWSPSTSEKDLTQPTALRSGPIQNTPNVEARQRGFRFSLALLGLGQSHSTRASANG